MRIIKFQTFKSIEAYLTMSLIGMLLLLFSSFCHASCYDDFIADVNNPSYCSNMFTALNHQGMTPFSCDTNDVGCTCGSYPPAHMEQVGSCIWGVDFHYPFTECPTYTIPVYACFLGDNGSGQSNPTSPPPGGCLQIGMVPDSIHTYFDFNSCSWVCNPDIYVQFLQLQSYGYTGNWDSVNCVISCPDSQSGLGCVRNGDFFYCRFRDNDNISYGDVVSGELYLIDRTKYCADCGENSRTPSRACVYQDQGQTVNGCYYISGNDIDLGHYSGMIPSVDILPINVYYLLSDAVTINCWPGQNMQSNNFRLFQSDSISMGISHFTTTFKQGVQSVGHGGMEKRDNP